MTSVLLLGSLVLMADPERPDPERYLRPTGKGFTIECEFHLARDRSSISSVTGRGASRLIVSSRYDDHRRLIAASATLKSEGKSKSVTVAVAGGKATVERAGIPPQVLDVPPEVIVTSAPDWTDTFLLCRRYDRKAGGKQSFPGLWIHPDQAARQLTFTIERTGNDTIDDRGRKVVLDRYTIVLRGNSTYVAWADAAGRMIKLVPLPFQEKANNWLIRDGYEASAASLQPR